MISTLLEPQRAQREAIADLLAPGPKLDAAGCLAIYQRSYILRLRQCLEEQFPATRRLLGDALFRDFADAYLRDRPSDSYTLFELGRRFPNWLDESRPDRDEPLEAREAWIDFMVDLTHYERELYRLFDAEGHEGEDWPNAETPDADLALQPCLSLQEYRYPVALYHHGARAGGDAEIPEARRSFVVISRKDYQITAFPVTELHHRFLRAIQTLGGVTRALGDIAAWTRRPCADVERSWRDDVRAAWLNAGFFVSKRAPRPGRSSARR
jgi:hypothetical protein